MVSFPERAVVAELLGGECDQAGWTLSTDVAGVRDRPSPDIDPGLASFTSERVEAVASNTGS
jgi:hypothetical protein